MSFSSEVWGYKYNVTSIADYDKHVLYIINWEQNTCGKSELEGEMTDHCIPEDAQFLGSMRYGLGDKNRIDADVWKFTKKQQFPMPQTLTMTMEVTADMCIPVVGSGFGEDESGNKYTFGASYYDHQPNIASGVF